MCARDRIKEAKGEEKPGMGMLEERSPLPEARKGGLFSRLHRKRAEYFADVESNPQTLPLDERPTLRFVRACE